MKKLGDETLIVSVCNILQSIVLVILKFILWVVTHIYKKIFHV